MGYPLVASLEIGYPYLLNDVDEVERGRKRRRSGDF